MQRHVTRISVGAIQALRATPVEAALAFGAAAATSLRIADQVSSPTTLRIILGCALAFAAVFAASVSHAVGVVGGRARWLLTAVAGGAAALAAFFLEPSRQTEMWRWAILLIAGVAAVLLVPGAAPVSGLSASERFWRFAVRLGARAAAALAYGSLLFVGIAVALWALEKLFGIPVHAQVYGHVAAWLFLGATPLVALGGLADAKRVNEPLPAGTIEQLGTAGTFLFVPLVLLYLLLLCSYVAKVAVTQVVPSNILSPLTLGAGALGYFGLFALHPHLVQQERRALRWVLQLFPIAFLVLVPVGLSSVLTRVGQYGWTEFRYARAASLACLGLLSLVHSLATLRRRTPSLTAGPALALTWPCSRPLARYRPRGSAPRVSSVGRVRWRRRPVSSAPMGGCCPGSGSSDASWSCPRARGETWSRRSHISSTPTATALWPRSLRPRCPITRRRTPSSRRLAYGRRAFLRKSSSPGRQTGPSRSTAAGVSRASTSPPMP